MKRLPERVREEIGRLRKKGRTLDEIIAHLKTLEAQSSRSALGCYTKNVDAIGNRIQEIRALAEVLVERFGSGRALNPRETQGFYYRVPSTGGR